MSVLDNQSKLNPTQAFYAPASGGGGGGGGGPNLTVSTITFPPAGGGNPPGAGAILMSSQLLIDDPATGIAGDFSFTTNNGLVGAAGAVSTTAFSIYAPNNASVFNMYAGADQALYITGSASGGDPVLYFRGIGNVNISTLTCSTINGAVPGGGGGGGGGSVAGGIAVSSITSYPGQATPSTILMAPGPGGNFALTGYPLTVNPLGDIILDTNISANALATTFQPGGTANAVLIRDPNDTGTSLNMGGTTHGGAVIAAVDSVSGNPSSLTIVAGTTTLQGTLAVSSISANEEKGNIWFTNYVKMTNNLDVYGPLVLSNDSTAAGGYLQVQANDTNQYAFTVADKGGALIAEFHLGTAGSRNQLYTNVGEISSLYCSLLNGSPPPPEAGA
jgi:hypothetical protein